MFDFAYRLWLLKALTRSFVIPLGAVHIGLRFVPLPPVGRVAVYVLAIPALRAIAYRFGRWRDDVAARRLGISLLPQIKGRTLGNIDVAQRIAQEDYAGYNLDQLLDEAGCDTARVSVLWTTDVVITRDPEVFKYAYNGGFPREFAAVEESDIRIKTFWGSGIFGVNGEEWKVHRAIARPHFAKDQITDYTIFSRYINKLLVILRQHAETGSPIDVQDLFSRFTLDTSGEFLFGSADFNILDLMLPKAGSAQLGSRGTLMPPSAYGSFGQAFDGAQQTVIKRVVAGDLVWTVKEFFGDRLVPDMKVIHDYLTPLAQAALDRKEKRHESGVVDGDDETGRSFLDHLADSTNDVKGIRDQLVNILLAARDTTACLLSFTCYNLARNPSVMTRLREDIISAIGDSETPDYDDLRKIKYLRAVLNETLRLFPPVSMGIRTSLVPCTLQTSAGPVYLPRAGIKVLFSQTGLHKRKDLWGDDAEEFDPDRWLDERGATSTSPNFVPFGSGPRVCLGQDFAYNEASFVLVRILQTFDSFTMAQKEAAPTGSLPPVEWAGMGGRKAVEEVVPLTAITMFSKGGLWLRMHSNEASS